MIRVTKAAAGHIPAVSKIYNEIHTEEEQGRALIGWSRETYPTEKTAAGAQALGELYVMEDEGEIVAAAIINKTQPPSYETARWEYPAPPERVLVLHTLVVSPRFPRKGYGKAFVEFYERLAMESDCPYLRIDTNALNAPARALYKKLGYKEIDIVKCEFNGLKDVNLVCLEKTL